MGVARPLLLVEQDAELRRALAELLQYDGYSVLAASDQEQALIHLDGRPMPGLLVLGLSPRLDGMRLLLRIRTTPRFAALPVLLIQDPVPQHPDWEVPHVKACLGKPLFLESFLAAVQQWYQPALLDDPE